jgi:hypothetical protein
MSNKQLPTSLGFNTEWARTRYYIENGRILPIPGAAVEGYNPFEYYDSENKEISEESLHIQFANWDFSTNAGINEFCNTWGLLGLGQRNALIPWAVRTFDKKYRVNFPPKEPDDIAKAYAEPWRYMAEPVDEFKEEAFIFKWTLSACNALKDNNIEEQEKLLDLPFEDEMECDEFLFSAEFSITEELEICTTSTIEYYLKNIHPVLKQDLTLQWEFSSLLDALYMMLALDYQEKRFIRVCKSTTCNKVFATGREDKIYCSRECALRQANRDYRARKRLLEQRKQ